MKKLFAILAIFGMMSVGLSSVLFAQETTPEEQTEQVAATQAQVQEVTGGLHQALKVKFIEGGAGFMSSVAICLILGLAFSLERIIYLSLADVDPDAFLNKVGDALDRGDVEAAKDIARDTRGPIASIVYQGLLRLDQGADEVERSIVSYGGEIGRAHV